jgi:uridine kinase
MPGSADRRISGPAGSAHRESLPAADGVQSAARLAVTRPPRLGAVRLVAVDGPSGSGKTSLAAPLASAIAELLGGRVVRPERTRDHAGSPGPGAAPPGSSPPSGRPLVTVVSTDLLATWEEPLEWWPVLEHDLLAPLASGRAADLPVMQWVSGNPRPGGSVHVPPVDLLVLEGVSSGRRVVADRLTLLVWVELPDRAERLERAVARDGEQMRPFLVRWQDDEDAHFAADRTRDRADVVVMSPNSG